MIKSFRDLEVYKRSLDLDHKIYKLSLDFPKFELYELGSQMRKSAHSVPANIAEGYGRKRYKSEFIRFLIYALASIDETKVHLETALKRKYISLKIYKDLAVEYNEIGRMISAIINKWVKK